MSWSFLRPLSIVDVLMHHAHAHTQPITMLRNALGKAEGGSGVPLDREKYMESVEYWKKHAVIVVPPKA